MGFAPGLNAAHLIWSSEVIAVAVFAEPFALAGCLAGLSASGVDTVPLTVCRSWIRNEELVATTALASGFETGHGAYHLAQLRSERKRKTKWQENDNGRRKKSFQREEPEEKPTEENGFSNRHVFTTFIPPLTPFPKR